MDVAQIDGMPLLGRRGARSSGAAFAFTSAAPKTGSIGVGSRWEVSFKKGSDALEA